MYEWAGFGGLMLMLTFAPIALVASVVSWNTILAMTSISRGAKLLTVFVAATICWGISLIALVTMLRPWVTAGTTDSSQDPLSALFGAFFIGAYLPLGASLSSAFVVSLSRSSRISATKPANVQMSSEEDVRLLLSSSSRRQYPSKRYGWPVLILVVCFAAVLPAVLFLSAVFPPIWNLPISTYYALVSPYAWNTALSDTFVLKMYIDVVAFYVTFVSLVVACFIYGRVGKGNRFVAPAMVVVAVIALSLTWLVYWTFYYTRIASGNVTGHVSERLARSAGHLANLFLSFTSWPVARNSIWGAAAGIPFEDLILVHRWMGTAFYGATGKTVSIHS